MTTPLPTLADLFALLTWLLFITGVFAGLAFLWHDHQRRSLTGQLYLIRAPRQVGSPRQFFEALHGLLLSPLMRLRWGQPWLSLEVSGSGGRIAYYVWMPEGREAIVSDLLRAAYPDVELTPVDDPLPPDRPAAVARFRLYRSSFLPLRTKFDGDPLASLHAGLTRPTADEHVHATLLVRPKPSQWQRSARIAALRMRQGGASAWRSASSTERTVTAHDLERARLMEDKARGHGFDCRLRLAVWAEDRQRARTYLMTAIAGLRPFDAANSLKQAAPLIRSWFEDNFMTRRIGWGDSFILTPGELAGLWHLPSPAPHGLDTVRSRKLPPPPDLPSEGKVMAEAMYPGPTHLVRLTDADSRLHVHIGGPTGSGKTSLLARMFLADAAAGKALAAIDPKGDLVAAVLESLPPERLADVILISPERSDRSIGVNPLEAADDEERDLIIDNAVALFSRIYAQYWGPRTDDVAKSALATLMTKSGATLCHVPMILSDPAFRARYTRDLDDPIGLGHFWQQYDGLSPARQAEWAGPLSNKLRDFLLRPRIRRVLCQSRSTIDFDQVVNGRKILLADLSVGRWGEATSTILGSFLVMKLWQAVRRRAALPEPERQLFGLYVDELQHFMSIAGPLADTLATARSLGMAAVLANQHQGQLSKELREGLASNARTRITFQAGRDDAAYLAKEMTPLSAEALMNLPRFEMAVRLAINGQTSRAFTARTLPPEPATDPDLPRKARALSDFKYGRPNETIDAEIRAVFEPPASVPTGRAGRRPRR